MRYLRETSAVAQRILTELLRRRRSIIFWAVFPLMILLLNGLILDERTPLTQAEAFRDSTASTLLGAALFFSCLGGSVATVVAEREQQTLKRLFLSPLCGVSYFLGIFLAHSLIGVGQTLLVYAVAASLGANFTGSVWLSGSIILMSIAAYVGVGFVLGTQLAQRTDDVNTLVATFGVPLLILGGAFVPSTFFPDILLDLARYNPIYHMIEALYGVSSQGQTLGDIQSHFNFLLGFTALMVAVGWLSYRRMLQIERRL